MTTEDFSHNCPLLSALWRGHGEAIVKIYWADGYWWATNLHCATAIQYCPWCGVCLDKLLVLKEAVNH